MSKGDYPPLRMVIEGGKLSPATPFDAERIDSYRRGTVVNVRFTEDKDRVLVRKWWAVLGLVIKKCQTPWKNKEEASEAIKLALGVVNLSKTVGGQFMQYPKSLTELDDPELSELLEQMMELLHRITGVDPETLRKESAYVGEQERELTQQATGEPGEVSEADGKPDTKTLSGDDYTANPDTGEITDNTDGEATGYSPATDAAPAGEDGTPPKPSPAPLLVRYARDVLNQAARSDADAAVLKKMEGVWATDIAKLSDEDREKAKAIAKSMRAIFSDPEKLDGILEHYAIQLDVDVSELRPERTEA